METLPTDNEFLSQLYERFKDKEWVARWEKHVKTVDLAEAVERSIAGGIAGNGREEELSQLIEESLTPSQLFRGKFIQMLKVLALHMLKPFRDKLEAIPVGCLPTRMLNGTTFRTPRGGHVIVLDQGVIMQLAILVRSYFAYYTWHTREPYCRDHSQAEFGRTIRLLAAFSVSGELGYLRNISTWDCPSLPQYDDVIEIFPMMIEVAILLHEYGHVVLGHLGSCRVMPLHFDSAGDLTTYLNSQGQELEADEFAFRQMTEGMKPGLDSLDIAFSFGLLFNFFHLGDQIQPPEAPTHPPALVRWERIKRLAGVPGRHGAWANDLDSFFMKLAKGLSR